MDDLVQVLLFVLTLLIFIFSALRKQKKKPAVGTSTADDLLESIFGIPQTNPLMVPLEDEIVEERSKETVTKPIAVPLPDEGIVAIQNKTVVTNSEFDELETSIPSFDLRTAIIYKEILTRRNF